jgi:hypothetical protein
MQKDKDFQPLYASTVEVDLLALEDMLAEAGIETARIDQRDRMYPMLGQVQILVHSTDFERAQEVLKRFITDERRN